MPADGLDLRGHCPMGCGQTLFVGENGHVTCAWADCPNPLAVDQILNDPETEHLVWIWADNFDVQHPLRERLDGELTRCDLHQFLCGLDEPPVTITGQYRVRAADGEFTWELLGA